MRCTNPIRLGNPRKKGQYGAFKKIMTVPCGKCIACRVNRSEGWKRRILDEFNDSNLREGCFITLTYFPNARPLSSLNGYTPTLDKRDIQLFLKNCRAWIRRHYGKEIKYYCCGEYGDASQLPHYHVIIIGFNFKDAGLYYTHTESVPYKGPKKCYTSKSLDDLWKLGFTDVGTLTADSCGYVAKYVQKKLFGVKSDEEYLARGRIPPFSLFSRGLGRSYAIRNAERLYKDKGIYLKGNKVNLPKYYINVLSQLGYDMTVPENLDIVTDIYDKYKEYYKYTNGASRDEAITLMIDNLKYQEYKQMRDIEIYSTRYKRRDL